jgi:hypothetical protein
MKKILIAITTIFWSIGLILVGSSTDVSIPLSYQFAVCLLGLLIFAVSSFVIFSLLESCKSSEEPKRKFVINFSDGVGTITSMNYFTAFEEATNLFPGRIITGVISASDWRRVFCK